jgi:flagellar hook-length control protein FliK
VIAITAQTKFDYVEPVVQKGDPVDDSPYVHENDEDENQSSFSEILAALFSNKPADLFETTEDLLIEHSDVLTEEVQESDFFSNEQLAINNEQLIGNEQSNLRFGVIGNGQLTINNEQLIGNEQLTISNDQLAINNEQLIGNEQLTINSEQLIAGNDQIALDKQSDDSQIKADPASQLKAASVSASQINEEALVAEKNALKEKQFTQPLLKTEKTETETASILSSVKKSGEEDTVSHNKQKPDEKPGRLDELRNRSRREKIAFEIRDQRTMGDTRSFVSVEAAAARLADNPIKDITLELRLPDFNNAGQSAQTTWEVKASNAMENMLARELHQNFNGDIVRHASMALKNGGESIIRLNLKPESLGNVKIRLEMTDNKVTGFIIVESEEALNAFRKELSSLEQAFKDAGFSDANLDLSLADDGKNAWQQQEEKTLTAQIAALNYQDSLRGSVESETGAVIDVFGEKYGSVNMLA